MKEIHHLIIIGSGPAGLTAGIYAARSNLNPLIIEGKNPGGQLMGTSYIENWPGDKKVLGPDLMARMRDHAQELGCSFVSGEITAVDFSKAPFSITTHRNTTFEAKAIIIATGATPKKLHVSGEQEYWGKGVTTCAVCDGAFYKEKEVIIVGGGDTAMEDASFMTKYTNKITVIHILDKLTASHAMQERVLHNPAITIIYSSTIREIHGDGKKVTQAVIINKKTDKKTVLNVDGIFVAIGLNPNTNPFKNQLAMNAYGYLQVTDFVKTSVNGIFAAGDVADDRYRQAITSAGTGCMAALEAERYLSRL